MKAITKTIDATILSYEGYGSAFMGYGSAFTGEFNEARIQVVGDYSFHF